MEEDWPRTPRKMPMFRMAMVRMAMVVFSRLSLPFRRAPHIPPTHSCSDSGMRSILVLSKLDSHLSCETLAIHVLFFFTVYLVPLPLASTIDIYRCHRVIIYIYIYISIMCTCVCTCVYYWSVRCEYTDHIVYTGMWGHRKGITGCELMKYSLLSASNECVCRCVCVCVCVCVFQISTPVSFVICGDIETNGITGCEHYKTPY